MRSIAAVLAKLRRWRAAQLDVGRELDGFQADRPEQYCPRCGASAGPGSVTASGCAFCLRQSIAWHRITRLGEYGPPLDEAIRAMKFGGDWARAGWFGRQLAPRVGVTDESNTIVVPVPMHRFRQGSRGYNQAQLIAEALAEARGLRMLPLLKRVRHTRPQSRLPHSKRATNVVRAFAAYPVDLSGQDVLLVDDVKTSGATLAGCARLLRDLDARVVHCVTVAVADPSHHRFART